MEFTNDIQAKILLKHPLLFTLWCMCTQKKRKDTERGNLQRKALRADATSLVTAECDRSHSACVTREATEER